MPARKYNCPRCHLAFVSRRSPHDIRCPACHATVPPPAGFEEQDASTSFFGWVRKAFVGTLAVIASPVMMLTNAVGASEPVVKTPAAERRQLGLVIAGLAFVGVVTMFVTFMVRALREAPEPDRAVQKLKEGREPAPQQPAPAATQTAEAPQQQTGVPVIDQLHAEKAPDLDLVLEQMQNRYDAPTSGSVKLPKLETIKAWTLAPPPAPLEADRQKLYDAIVDRFLLYRAGKQTGAEAYKAVTDFHQLPLDAIPALVRGLNLAVTRPDATGTVIARKLRGLLDATDDRSFLAYARENIGKDVAKPAHPDVIAALIAYLDQRLETPKDQLKQNLPILLAALNHPDPRVRAEAANALGSLGADAQPAVAQLTQLLSDPNRTVRAKAARALVEAGPDAVPALVSALKDKKSRPYAAAALTEVRPIPDAAVNALIDNLKEPEPEQRGAVQSALITLGPVAVGPLIGTLKDKTRRDSAALTLGRMGKSAEAALPDLMEGLNDPDATFRISSHQALVHMGPSAVPQLIQALKDPSDRVWYSAVLALGKIGPAAKSAVPALMEAMKSDNKGLRILALNALVRIEPDHRAIDARVEEIVPVLADSLRHAEPALRLWSCVCLGKIGRGAKPAAPELAAALKDKDLRVRIQAAMALGQIGPDAKDASKSLIEALADAPVPLRAAAVAALARLGDGVAEQLTAALKHRQDSVRSGAADALVRIGLPALPAVIAALRDPDATACRLATGVLQRIGPPARDAVPALLVNLKDQDRQVRFATVEAVRAIRPHSTEALRALWNTLQDPSGAVADEARQALVSWKLERTAVSTVLTFLESKSVDHRVLALTMLGNLGRDAAAAAPAVIALLKDAEPRTRQHAAQALGAIAPSESAPLAALIDALHDTHSGVCSAVQVSLVRAGARAVPGLSQALADKDGGACVLAAEALSKLGPAARPAVPALLSACKHEDPRVRLQAVLTLHDLEPSSTSVLQALLDRLGDTSTEVRTAAHRSLVQSAPAAFPLLIAALKHKDATLRRGVLGVLKNIALEGTTAEELLGSLGELTTVLRDADKEVRDEAAQALAAIHSELKAAVPALVSLVAAGRSNSQVKAQADLRYVTEGDLVAAALADPGPRMKSILEELRRRRGGRILAALAFATIHTDADARQLARKLIVQYLAQKLKPGDEQQAAARLKLYKQLDDDGKKGTAGQRYPKLRSCAQVVYSS